MIIYLDFDGTVVEHDYPRIGKPNPNAIKVITKLRENHDVFLNTYRANLGDFSTAVEYLYKKGIKLSHVLLFKLTPKSWDWDRMLTEQIIWVDALTENIPMKDNMVNWIELEKQFKENKLL